MKLPDSWWLDVKLGLRMLTKYPGLTLSGVIGIATAVAIAAGGFSVVYVNLLASSLPLEEGDRIVAIGLSDTRSQAPEPHVLYHFHAWRDSLESVQEVSAFQTLTLNLITPGAVPESVRVAAMSASGFRAARVRPLLGRYLTDEDERSGTASVVVINESLWRSRFGGDPAILGRTIRLGSTPSAVVGVMPSGFGFPVNHGFWVPLRTGVPSEPLTGPALAVFGRLAPGATLESAQAELTAIDRRTKLSFPKVHASIRAQLTPYPAAVFRLDGQDDMRSIVAMQGIVVALLVLVCANVAILVYTRTAMRQAEIGLRTALGASRGRIVLQLFLEALVLSILAAIAGVFMAALALRQVAAVTQNIASDLPFWLAFRLSPQAVLYAGVLSILAAVIIGIVPGLQATGSRLQNGLRVIGAGGAGMRFATIWSALIVAQVGFAVALLPLAVLSVSENLPYTLAGPGFAANEFLSATLDLATGTNTGAPEMDRYASRHAELMRRLTGEPNVSGATFSASGPGDERGARIEAEGALGVIHEARFNRVATNFFEAFDVPVLAGRGFQAGDLAPAKPGDRPQGGAVVVSQRLAEQLFGGNALGRRIRYAAEAESSTEPGRWYEIVGIVSNFPTGVSAGMRDSQAKVYHAADAGQVQPAVLALHTRGAPASFGQRLRKVAAEVDPDLLLRDVRGLEEVLRREQWIVRLEASVVLAVTVSVLLLSSVGIYSLMSFTVSQRGREIGIRMALGASGTSIVVSVFSRALKQVVTGAVLGAGLCLVGGSYLGGQLDKVSMAVLVVVVAMGTVGLLAALGPTRRSLRTQPTEALRDQ